MQPWNGRESRVLRDRISDAEPGLIRVTPLLSRGTRGRAIDSKRIGQQRLAAFSGDGRYLAGGGYRLLVLFDCAGGDAARRCD